METSGARTAMAIKPEWEQVEPGVYSVLRDGTVWEARRDGNTVTVNGQAYVVEIADPRRWSGRSGGAQGQGRVAVKAPMPGKIVRVLVAEGDEVEAGAGVVVMEAMKMQNELKTSRTGRVVSVSVQQHDTVESGAVLVVVE